VLEAPARDARVLFLNAKPGLALPDGFEAEIMAVQGFRPDYLALRRAALNASPEPVGDDYDVTLVLCGRHRGQNEAWIDEALRRTRGGGLIVVAGGKTDGVASLRKRVAAITPVAGHASKHHGLVFWLERSALPDRYAGDISKPPQPVTAQTTPKDGGFETAPGMFSHEHVDPGSRLLAECLPSVLKGSAADFCAGWGYLAVALAERASGIKSIDLYEADHASLGAARRNVARLAPTVNARFFWHDLVAEPVAERYDVIVMNPPFHAGRAAEPGLGEALIRTAARALKPGGQLFMVANRQLPYEATLSQAFGKVAKLREEQGFKVFCARR
jgi:16S rRNA (guanine1207-N2)-methyltransferase